MLPWEGADFSVEISCIISETMTKKNEYCLVHITDFMCTKVVLDSLIAQNKI